MNVETTFLVGTSYLLFIFVSLRLLTREEEEINHQCYHN